MYISQVQTLQAARHKERKEVAKAAKESGDGFDVCAQGMYEALKTTRKRPPPHHDDHHDDRSDHGDSTDDVDYGIGMGVCADDASFGDGSSIPDTVLSSDAKSSGLNRQGLDRQGPDSVQRNKVWTNFHRKP